MTGVKRIKTNKKNLLERLQRAFSAFKENDGSTLTR